MKALHIDLRHYKTEWEILDDRIKELRKINPLDKNNLLNKNKRVHSYLQNKMMSLVNDYKENPNYILESLSDKGEKKVKVRHYVPIEVYNIFKEISNKSNVPVTTIVNRLLISPLLFGKMI